MSSLSSIFKQENDQSIVKNEILLDADVCPNCWGIMEYNNQFVARHEDLTKSNINHDLEHQKAFVLQFVETHVTGIHLQREGDRLSCPKCKAKYKYVGSKAN